MPPELVLIDSSVWIEAIHPRGLPECRDLARHVMTQDRGATCEVIVAEVLKGASTEEALSTIQDGMAALRHLSMDGVGSVAGRLALTLRARGLALPTTDLLIAATCSLHGAAILHRDKHLALAVEVLGLEEYAA
jgi:predicted nucleic acid-binding protein